MTKKNLRNLVAIFVLVVMTVAALASCGNTEPNVYTVNFVNEDGSILQSVKVEEGETPSYTGETPTKASDAEYTYTFVGWDNEIAAATGDATYKATFSGVKNKYTVTFKNHDGSVLATLEDVEYGTVVSYPQDAAEPTKASDDGNTYSFSGWDKALSAVTGDVTYTAQFSTESKTFSVKFLGDDGETVISEKNDYHFGDSITAPTATKTATAQYVYTFAGWKLAGTEDSAIVAVDATVSTDRVYVAVFNESVRKYDVEFYASDAEDATLLYVAEQVPYGETPEYKGETPTTIVLGLSEFSGWNNEIAAVDGTNLKYVAVFTPVYTYSVKSGDVSADFNDKTLVNGLMQTWIQNADAYTFTVSDVDYTEHKSVTLKFMFNYDGIALSVGANTIGVSVKNSVMDLTVTKDGSVYLNEAYVGTKMQNGVIEFSFTRNAETHKYSEFHFGYLAYDAMPEYSNISNTFFAPPATTTVTGAAASDLTDLAYGISYVNTFVSTGWSHQALDDVDLSNYSVVKFLIKKADGSKAGELYTSGGNWEVDWKCSPVSTGWTMVKLVRDADGKFDVIISGSETKNDGYGKIEKLSEIFMHSDAAGGTYYLSNLMGIEICKHQWNDGEITKTPTCTEVGVKTYTCTSCPATKTEEIAKASHTVGDIISEVAATCSDTGMAAHYQCSVCQGYLDADKAEKTAEELTLQINPEAHTWASEYSHDGNNHWIDCTSCDVTKDTEKHSGTGTDCTQAIECTTCHSSFTAGHAVNDDAHHAGTAATCTESGTKDYYECISCSKKLDADGNVIEDLTISALGHDFTKENAIDDARVTTATCKAQATYHYSCSRTDCSAIDTEGTNGTFSAGELDDHAYEFVAETADMKAHYICNVCDKYFAVATDATGATTPGAETTKSELEIEETVNGYVVISDTPLNVSSASSTVTSSTITTDLAFDGSAITNVFTFTKWTSGIKAASNIDITKYNEIMFYVKIDKGDIGYKMQGETSDRWMTSTDWTQFKLVYESTNVWTFYIDGKWTKSSMTGSTLTEFFTAFTTSATNIYTSELFGILNPDYVDPWSAAADPVFTLSGGSASEETAPEGFNTVTSYTTSWNKYTFNSVDLTQYSEVKFAVKTTTKGFGVMSDANTVIGEASFDFDWLTIRFVKNGDAWDLYYGDTFKQSLTLANNNLTDLYFRFGSDTYYVTELQVKK